MNERQLLGRMATAAAVLTAPLAIVWFHAHGHSWPVSALLALLFVGALRGGADLILRKALIEPKLSLDAEPEEMADDALRRRRLHFWTKKFRLLVILSTFVTVMWLWKGGGRSWFAEWGYLWAQLTSHINGAMIQQLIILPIFFLANFLLFFGPMMMMGISQMSGLEPGDADFGVRLADVRGQKEAKEEIRKVVTLWQAGDTFVKSGGKRERGILFLGPPGTGKTMLAKAIATGFNSPIVMMPGSGFAQTFIGMDVIIVRYMARKARKLASKWGGQCIVFIDEIDAVGMRRAALGGGMPQLNPQVPGGMMGGMGQMGLQSLLVVMDGIDNPPFLRKFFTNKVNLYMDVLYLFPQKLFGRNFRIPKAKPTNNQIFFVGATNVPLESLDPALTRPGRMGRHIHFRSPKKKDRIDIFDLYLGKVAHDPELDTDKAREELARITDGYSPAQIEQACSIALTYAVHEEREAFTRADLLEAMVTIEAGTALGWGYELEEEERAVAIHEAGHAVTSYLYQPGFEATRLSIRMRGQSGGHHQSVEQDERFAYRRSELMGELICILGAYAAEYTYFGESAQGVTGDLGMASVRAGMMVGVYGMAPPVPEGADEKALVKIGQALVQVVRQGQVPLGPQKNRAEALILGIAFVTAWNATKNNTAGIDKIVTALQREKEISGDDLTRLLDSAGLEAPEIDWSSADSYPEL